MLSTNKQAPTKLSAWGCSAAHHNLPKDWGLSCSTNTHPSLLMSRCCRDTQHNPVIYLTLPGRLSKALICKIKKEIQSVTNFLYRSISHGCVDLKPHNGILTLLTFVCCFSVDGFEFEPIFFYALMNERVWEARRRFWFDKLRPANIGRDSEVCGILGVDGRHPHSRSACWDRERNASHTDTLAGLGLLKAILTQFRSPAYVLYLQQTRQISLQFMPMLISAT